MRTSILFIFLLILLFSSCNSGKTWEQVKNENTIEAYVTFLNDNPETKHLDSIKLLLKKLDWLDAKSEKTAESLDMFLEKHPEDSVYTDSINEIKSEIAWNEVSDEKSIEAYENFIKEYPESPFKSDAKSKVEGLSWEKVKKENRAIEYLNFLSKYKYKHYADSVKSLNIIFELGDYEEYSVSFVYDSEAQNDGVNTFETISLNFRENGKLDGEIEGFQEGDNYSNAWNENVKGEYVKDDFISIQSQLLGQSDEYYEGEPKPEPWGDCDMEYNAPENAIYYKDRIYIIKEISKVLK